MRLSVMSLLLYAWCTVVGTSSGWQSTLGFFCQLSNCTIARLKVFVKIDFNLPPRISLKRCPEVFASVNLYCRLTLSNITWRGRQCHTSSNLRLRISKLIHARARLSDHERKEEDMKMRIEVASLFGELNDTVTQIIAIFRI